MNFEKINSDEAQADVDAEVDCYIGEGRAAVAQYVVKLVDTVEFVHRSFPGLRCALSRLRFSDGRGAVEKPKWHLGRDSLCRRRLLAQLVPVWKAS